MHEGLARRKLAQRACNEKNRNTNNNNNDNNNLHKEIAGKACSENTSPEKLAQHRETRTKTQPQHSSQKHILAPLNAVGPPVV